MYIHERSHTYMTYIHTSIHTSNYIHVCIKNMHSTFFVGRYHAYIYFIHDIQTCTYVCMCTFFGTPLHTMMHTLEYIHVCMPSSCTIPYGTIVLPPSNPIVIFAVLLYSRDISSACSATDVFSPRTPMTARDSSS